MLNKMWILLGNQSQLGLKIDLKIFKDETKKVLHSGWNGLRQVFSSSWVFQRPRRSLGLKIMKNVIQWTRMQICNPTWWADCTCIHGWMDGGCREFCCLENIMRLLFYTCMMSKLSVYKRHHELSNQTNIFFSRIFREAKGSPSNHYFFIRHSHTKIHWPYFYISNLILSFIIVLTWVTRYGLMGEGSFIPYHGTRRSERERAREIMNFLEE